MISSVLCGEHFPGMNWNAPGKGTLMMIMKSTQVGQLTENILAVLGMSLDLILFLAIAMEEIAQWQIVQWQTVQWQTVRFLAIAME